MSERLEYIDAYFNSELNESERKQFEDRCSADEEFAKDVAFYVMAREEARQSVIKQKQQWKNDFAAVSETVVLKPATKPMVLRWIPYAAAACLVFIMSFYFLLNRQSPERIAANYIKSKYSVLYQSMDGSTKDSLQLGIAEYNKGNYSRALALFEWVGTADSTNYDARKYAGLTYFQTKEYDKALLRFKELSAIKSPYNAGDILEASTLLQRNAAGDKEAAKQLLQKVVQENEEGNDMAKEALQKWNS